LEVTEQNMMKEIPKDPREIKERTARIGRGGKTWREIKWVKKQWQP
jgi:hypothetical protein